MKVVGKVHKSQVPQVRTTYNVWYPDYFKVGVLAIYPSGEIVATDRVARELGLTSESEDR